MTKPLVIQSKAPNKFSCDNVGLIHCAYACRNLNLLVGKPKCKKGDRYDLGSLTVEVLESDASDLPSRVVFRFNTSLDSPDFHWLRFDWERDPISPTNPSKFRPSARASRCPALIADAVHVPMRKIDPACSKRSTSTAAFSVAARAAMFSELAGSILLIGTWTASAMRAGQRDALSDGRNFEGLVGLVASRLPVEPEPVEIGRIQRGVEPECNPGRQIRCIRFQDFHREAAQVIPVAFFASGFAHEQVESPERVGAMDRANIVAGEYVRRFGLNHQRFVIGSLDVEARATGTSVLMVFGSGWW